MLFGYIHRHNWDDCWLLACIYYYYYLLVINYHYFITYVHICVFVLSDYYFYIHGVVQPCKDPLMWMNEWYQESTAPVSKYKNTWYQTHNFNYAAVDTVLNLFHSFIYNSLPFTTLTFKCPSGQFCPSLHVRYENQHRHFCPTIYT